MFYLLQGHNTYLFTNTYACIFLFFLIVFSLAVILSVLPKVVIKIKSYSFFQEKNSSYECGFEPFSSAHKTFDIHFVVVAILFLLFDFELLLMFPYVLGYDFTFAVYGPMSALNLFVFLFLLLVGFIYE